MSSRNHPEFGDELSAEELKIRLYNKFRDKGILNEMRSQLRNRLLTELHSVSKIDNDIMFINIQEDALLIRITDWFVTEHLQKCKYHSSLSVFAMESKSLDNSQNLITLKDVLNLLQIYPETKIYKNITEAEANHKQSSILSLILRLMGADVNFQKKKELVWHEERSVQTEMTELQLYSFHQKLQDIEDLYMLKKGIQKIEDEKSFEFHLMKYQQQLEERIKKEAKDEMNLFKEKEFLKIKLEIENKSMKEKQEYHRKLEQDYQEKFSALIEKEKKDFGEMNILKENVEKEVFLQRQEVLEHLETARRKEMETQKLQKRLQEEHDLENGRLKLHEQRLKMLEDNLLEEKRQLNNKVKTIIAKERLQEQLEYEMKIKEIKDEKERLLLVENQLKKEKQLIEQIKTDNNTSAKEINKLEEKLLEYQNENSILKREKIQIEEQLKNLPEINDLKSECNFSKSITKKLETLLEETEKERNSLKMQLNEMKNMLELPSPEMIRMKQEIKMLQDSHYLDKAVWEEHKARLENQLKLSHDQNQLLSQRLEQQSQLEKELQDRIQELHFRIQKIYKQNFKLSGGAEIPKKFADTTLINEQGTFFDTTLNPNTVPLELQLLNDNSSGDNFISSAVEPSNLSPNNRLFLHQSYYRMLALQKEADYLEKYGNRLKHAASNLKLFPEKHFVTALDSQIFSSLPKLDTVVHPKETEIGKYLYSSKIDIETLSESNFNSGVPIHNSSFEDMYLFTDKKIDKQTIPYTNTFAWNFSYKPNLIESYVNVGKTKSKTSQSMVNESENVLHSTFLFDEENNFNEHLIEYDTGIVNTENISNESVRLEKHHLSPLMVRQLKINDFINDPPLINESTEKSLIQNDPPLINEAKNSTELIEMDIKNRLEITVDSVNEKSSKNQNNNDEGFILSSLEKKIDDKEFEKSISQNDLKFNKSEQMIAEVSVLSHFEQNDNENINSQNNFPDKTLQQIDLEAQWKINKENIVIHNKNPISSTVDHDKDLYHFNSDNTANKTPPNISEKSDEASKGKTNFSSPKNLSEIDDLSLKQKDASASNTSTLDNIEHFSVGSFNPSSGDDDW